MLPRTSLPEPRTTCRTRAANKNEWARTSSSDLPATSGKPLALSKTTLPFAARGINSAAEYVLDSAEKIPNGSFRYLIDGASGFAKRQPAAFLGISVLAGFAAVRFLKASGGESSSSQRGETQNGSSPLRGAAWDQSSSEHSSSWEQKSFSQPGNMS